MRLFTTTLLVGALALAASPAFAASKTIDLPAFTKVNISSGINAAVEVGGAQSVQAEAKDAAYLDELQIRVVGGELQAWVDWNLFDLFSFGDTRQLNLTISVPALTDVEASSGADVTVSAISGDDLSFAASSGADLDVKGAAGKNVRMETSSGADLNVEGTCESGTAEASSGADLDAEKLLCAKAIARASSGAGVKVFASASIDADASSGGEIEVHGKPAIVDDEESSGGDIEMAE